MDMEFYYFALTRVNLVRAGKPVPISELEEILDHCRDLEFTRALTEQCRFKTPTLMVAELRKVANKLREEE